MKPRGWRAIVVVVLGAMLGMEVRAAPPWVADLSDPLQAQADAAVQRILQASPHAASYFAQAYGFAVFASVARGGMGFGAAYGRGLVIEQGHMIGRARLWQLMYGLFYGGEWYSQIIFFKDKEALERYKTGHAEFLGRAAVALLGAGASGDPAFSSGVAIVNVTRFGLLVEITPGVGWYRFWPSP
jgi:lipid-binding SYLF domain-containing protein